MLSHDIRMFCRAIISRRWSASRQEAGAVANSARSAPTISGSRRGACAAVVRHRHEDVLSSRSGSCLSTLSFVRRRRIGASVLPIWSRFCIADDLCRPRRVLMLVPEAERRPEAEAIDELDDRDQLFQPVLQRRAGQHDGVGRVELLDACAVRAVQFLIRWASSRMTRSGAQSPIRSRSRWTVS